MLKDLRNMFWYSSVNKAVSLVKLKLQNGINHGFLSNKGEFWDNRDNGSNLR